MEKQRVNKRRDKKDKSNQSIKIVVRHLPPTMTEKEFLEQVDPLPENDSYYYCPADWSLGQEATCRAYIDMSLKDIAEVLQFRDRFDGYVFVDSKGAEYVAIVEYAPFQCFLKNKARSHDNKVNTIEKEPHFQEFLQKLAEEREEATRLGDIKIDFTFENRGDEKVKSTPLLQYLANKKEKRREEARKRNEEKRKHREEQKLLRSTEQPENIKVKDSGNENKKSLNSNAKKGFNKEGQLPEDTAKNARSKRRTERDQRRREEHEQRKLMRDRENRDKKKNDRHDKDMNQKPSKHSNSKKDIVILKKKSTADTNSPDPNTCAASSVDVSSEIPAKTDKSNEPAEKCLNSKEIGKSVPALSEVNSPLTSEEIGMPQDACKASNSRAAEERRIRNKDRPSIAIYQPKVRINLRSEDNSPSGCKDPARVTEPPLLASEGDSFVTDETPKNKRFGRRNKHKLQDTKDNFEHARRESKSSESSTSAHSTFK
ncbi:regulator of nonsense transcripts 3B [Drosophila virilis]|uniref:UPF3 domain-containing protein n=1 Tax=Drosophila virilis TaxID=7244 RepID=B4LNY5_DROVI|nr:regulator of nonsense transcripts 3B [Drosophila virilis]EDW61154.1 uncharacterized protein Dvir_GJ21877 [Drosophila virilis]